MKKAVLFLAMFLTFFVGGAQIDNLKNVFEKSTVNGYWRNYFMRTQNQGSLQDWNALATGGLLKYETGIFKNFKIGLGYYTSYNLNISDVSARDESTNKVSRYEAGLFDVGNLHNREIHFLGELYVQYKTKNHEFMAGRMKLKTAFLNPEDGRMIPTLEQGVLYKTTKLKKTTLQAGWFTHIAARSSVGFTSVENSIGIYPTGKNLDGSPSGYKNQLESKGIGLLKVDYKTKKIGVELTNYMVENIFNSAYLKAFYKLKRDKINWKISAQYLRQDQINNGGNDEINKAYFQHKESNVFGAQLEAGLHNDWLVSINYNYITANGPFLFPREWGRETLFTFQKRERLEGVANTNAFMVQLSKKWELKNHSILKIVFSHGHYQRPDVKLSSENKYAIPANTQTNLDVFYDCVGMLKGLGFEYLVSYKNALGETYGNSNFILNKVNMWNHNLVINYKF